MKTKAIILAIVAILIIGSIYYLENQKADSSSETETPADNVQTTQELSTDNPKDSMYLKAPELEGIVGYINTPEGTKISDFKGKVVLFDFWTYSCINCIRTLPYLTAWDEKYRDSGLVVIGVHTPEFEFEKDYDNLKAAVEEHNIQYPVVQDNNKETWRAYNNRFWPRKYLIDSEGYIRYDHIGEGAYAETEMKIQELLAEIGQEANFELEEEKARIILNELTPELYAGYDLAIPRGQNLGNSNGINPEKETTYSFPNEFNEDKIYLSGTWKSNSDSLELTSDEGSVVLKFKASEVNIVAEKFSSPVEVQILIDGNNRAAFTVDSPKLYNVYNGDYGTYTLELKTEKGFKLNSFTFG